MDQILRDTKDDCYTCCCSHPHHDDCPWLAKAKEEGLSLYQAHLHHIKALCLCPEVSKHKHSNYDVPGHEGKYEYILFYREDCYESDEEYDEYEWNDNILCCCGAKDAKHDSFQKF